MSSVNKICSLRCIRNLTKTLTSLYDVELSILEVKLHGLKKLFTQIYKVYYRLCFLLTIILLLYLIIIQLCTMFNYSY